MKKLSQLTRDFNAAKNSFAKLSSETPRIMGALGVKVMRENFDAQGFVETVGPARKWKERSKATNAMYDSRKNLKGSVYSSKNPILLQTKNLKNGITYKDSAKKVTVGVNQNVVPYAKLMNEGGLVQLGEKWVRVPARKYLGMSDKLKVRISGELKKRRTQALSKFKIAT